MNPTMNLALVPGKLDQAQIGQHPASPLRGTFAPLLEALGHNPIQPDKKTAEAEVSAESLELQTSDSVFGEALLALLAAEMSEAQRARGDDHIRSSDRQDTPQASPAPDEILLLSEVPATDRPQLNPNLPETVAAVLPSQPMVSSQESTSRQLAGREIQGTEEPASSLPPVKNPAPERMHATARIAGPLEPRAVESAAQLSEGLEVVRVQPGTNQVLEGGQSSLQPMGEATAASRIAPTQPPAAAIQQNSLQSPVSSSAWGVEFGQQLATLVRHGDQQISLHLNPQELGPLTVDIRVNEKQAQLHLFSPHAQVRGAVEQALPQLRDALTEQGVLLGDTHVSDQRQPPEKEQQPRHSSRETDQSPHNPQSGEQSADTVHGVLPVSGGSGINLYV